jgi:hypothetical protein
MQGVYMTETNESKGPPGSPPPGGIATPVEVDIIIDEIIDIEEFSKSGREPPRAKGYRIRVDKDHIIFDKDEVTGREILEKAGRVPPEKYVLREIFSHGGREKIELNQLVHLRHHHIEKFRTMLRSPQDG